MILFFAPGGRIGNLLFQIAHIECIRRPNEVVLATQMKGAHRILSGLEKYRNSDSPLLINLLDHVLVPFVVKPLAFLKLIGSSVEKEGRIKTSRGFFPITWVSGYFQDGRISINSTNQPFRLKLVPEIETLCVPTLSIAESRLPMFVHVRRGDYKDFLILGGVKPMLPEEWYKRALEALLHKIPDKDVHIFFVGDDPEWCEEVFSAYPYLTVCRSDPLHDLSLMARCAGGVVSNSTFAWWGASLGSTKKKIIAPRYWLGWQKRVWYPSTIETAGFTYIDVVEGE